jgi:hypothetical protein
MKLISGILICLVSLLAPICASAEGDDWRSVLEGEKAKNAQRMAAIEEKGRPIAAQLRQLSVTVDRHNAQHPSGTCEYPPGHPEVCTPWVKEGNTLERKRQSLRSQLIPLSDELDSLKARNAEIDQQLACRRALQPCSENSDCCSGNCALFADGRLSDAHICQPASR